MASKERSEVLREISFHLVGLLVLLLFPFYLLIFLPTLICRPIVRAIQPFIRPDLAGILSCTSSGMVQADERGEKFIILSEGTMQGRLDTAALRRSIEKRLICSRLPNGALRYPQLQQFITNWMGYKFWEWENNFAVANHVFVVERDPFDESQIPQLAKSLLATPLPKGKSPWDFTLVVGESETTIFFRVHHALADGFSILFLMQRLFGEDAPKEPIQAKFGKRSVSYFLKLPFKVLRTSGELAQNSVKSFLWKIPESKKSNEWTFAKGKQIPVKTIQDIKNHFGVSFSAVVFSIVAGGLDRFSKRKGTPTPELPNGIAVPIKGHPDALCNMFSFALTSYPMACTANPVDRLQMIHRNFENLRDSPVPLIGYYLLVLHGSHFNCVGKLINSYRYCPILTTYFPTGNPTWSFGSSFITELAFYVKIQQGQLGATFGISGFNNAIQISPAFNDALVSSSAEMEELCRDFDSEVDAILGAVNGQKEE